MAEMERTAGIVEQEEKYKEEIIRAAGDLSGIFYDLWLMVAKNIPAESAESANPIIYEFLVALEKAKAPLGKMGVDFPEQPEQSGSLPKVSRG